MEAEGQLMLTDASWPNVWTPRRPRATDDVQVGSWPMSRERALERRYLEHNPSALLSMIVIDVDHTDTLERALWEPRDHPAPNWVALSPSGRGHVGWVLEHPVCRTDAGHPRPLRWAARVQEGLRRSVDGDPGYANALTKNPTHEGWETYYGPAERYHLTDLFTIHTPRTVPRRAVTGLGRNVTMFDRARLWAYQAHRRYAGGPLDDWEQACVQRCHAVNSEFEQGAGGPLPFSEVQATARSIARWTWRNFLPFDQLQAQRGARNAGRPVSPAKREANQRRATKYDLLALSELDEGDDD